MKEDIKYHSETWSAYGVDFIIVINNKSESYVEFEVYHDNEFREFIFSCFLSYKHLMPYFGKKKKSNSKYHIQLGDIDDFKNYCGLLIEICEFVKQRFNI